MRIFLIGLKLRKWWLKIDGKFVKTPKIAHRRSIRKKVIIMKVGIWKKFKKEPDSVFRADSNGVRIFFDPTKIAKMVTRIRFSAPPENYPDLVFLQIFGADMSFFCESRKMALINPTQFFTLIPMVCESFRSDKNCGSYSWKNVTHKSIFPSFPVFARRIVSIARLLETEASDQKML